MTIQKKSLINSLNTTKKAIVASSTNAANPKRQCARRYSGTTKVQGQIRSRVNSRVTTRVKGQA